MKSKKICWVNNDTCCDTKTKEHVISESILRILGPLNIIKAGKNTTLGKGSYVVNLCERHNNALSFYDEEAVKLFGGYYGLLHKKANVFTPKNEGEKIIQLNGHHIEKWFAKSFFNDVEFYQKFHTDKKKLFHPSPRNILTKIFYGEEFANPFGLYLIKPEKPLSSPISLWQFSSQYREIHHVSQGGKKYDVLDFPMFLYVICGGVELIGFYNLSAFSDEFALENWLKPIRKLLEDRGVYRPGGFSTRINQGKKEYGPEGFDYGVRFSW
jgi:hypothetical protein